MLHNRDHRFGSSLDRDQPQTTDPGKADEESGDLGPYPDLLNQNSGAGSRTLVFLQYQGNSVKPSLRATKLDNDTN